MRRHKEIGLFAEDDGLSTLWPMWLVCTAFEVKEGEVPLLLESHAPGCVQGICGSKPCSR